MKMHVSTTDTDLQVSVQYARHPDEAESDDQIDIVQTIQTGQSAPPRSKGNAAESYIHIPRGANLNDYLPVKTKDGNRKG
ncbi:uncharacterized protein LAJ45_03326 [Morchella importuna]|uniref:uncharacterized protein n=1 Tax=Morchella importuna TaxID=1174673 RepID=UPI001E8DA583|nr:uncharacterized protein LAJ45_03326 [Morchella importuna]KAH8152486.1 hypothetical protein LAJ45_03326 [Morchella importuna]